MLLTISILAAATATLNPQDPGGWRGAAAADFACFVEKELGGSDPAFPCGGKALVEGCRVGPRISGLEAHRVHPLVRAVALDWRRGKLHSVRLWLPLEIAAKKDFEKALGLAVPVYEDCGMELCVTLPTVDTGAAGAACGSDDPAPPELPRESFGRLRTHFDGFLSADDRRVWIGPRVPAYVPLKDGSSELTILDESKEGHFAFYRDMYAEQLCNLVKPDACRFVAAFWKGDGTQAWRVELTPLLSAKERLEIQDARFDGGTLYYNEACQSYAKDSKGKCSALVAYDPVKKAELWRTKPLHSNHRFLVLPEVIVAGYGFTAEKDFVRVIRRSDGKVLDERPLKHMMEDAKVESDGGIAVVLDGGRVARFRLKDGKLSPR